MGRIIGFALALGLTAVVATPFVADALNRYAYSKELYQLSEPIERDSLAQRFGQIGGFVGDYTTRCQRIYGAGNPQCFRLIDRLRRGPPA